MKNEKCGNKTLRVCGNGGVRKNNGKWQAVVTVADEVTGKKVQRTKNTAVPCLKQGMRGKAAAIRCPLGIQVGGRAGARLGR